MQGILPETESEKYVLRVLRNAHFFRVLEYPDEELCDELLNPPPVDLPDTAPECPLPVTTAPLSCSKSLQLHSIVVFFCLFFEESI